MNAGKRVDAIGSEVAIVTGTGIVIEIEIAIGSENPVRGTDATEVIAVTGMPVVKRNGTGATEIGIATGEERGPSHRSPFPGLGHLLAKVSALSDCKYTSVVIFLFWKC